MGMMNGSFGVSSLQKKSAEDHFACCPPERRGFGSGRTTILSGEDCAEPHGATLGKSFVIGKRVVYT